MLAPSQKVIKFVASIITHFYIFTPESGSSKFSCCRFSPISLSSYPIRGAYKIRVFKMPPSSKKNKKKRAADIPLHSKIHSKINISKCRAVTFFTHIPDFLFSISYNLVPLFSNTYDKSLLNLFSVSASMRITVTTLLSLQVQTV